MEVSKVINQLSYKIRERAAATVAASLPTIEEVNEVIEKLAQRESLDYQAFRDLGKESPAAMRKYFGTSIFLMFPRTEMGEVNPGDVVDYIRKSVDIEFMSAELTKFSRGKDNSAYFDLTENELGAFLYSQIRNLIHTKIQFEFIRFYMIAAGRRFFFALDSKNSGSISTRKLLQSPILEDFLSMRRELELEADGREAQSSSWFYPDNVMDLYYDFYKLDKDQNGTLSVDELANFQGTKKFSIQLTRVAIERIFEVHVCNTQSAEMDFKSFVDLVLAIDNPKTKESQKYFWKALNIEPSERLTFKSITYFYSEVVFGLEQLNYSCPKVDDVVVEIFDILACNPGEGGATIDQIVACGQGDIVLIMLLDINSFWRYDNREQLMQQVENK